ncbi:MAG: pyridoxal phosphate-dependent aminotransferase [Bacteriovoracaceae bacterium]
MSRLDQISLGKIVVIREQLLEAQRKGTAIFRFESGDPNFDIHDTIKEAVYRALKENKTHYIPNNGIPELKDALVKKLKKQNKIEAKSADIFVTNGAMHALYVTYQCMIEEGDEVIVPDPMWTEAVENARLAGAKTIPVELTLDDNYIYRAEKIKEKITSKTKAIFLNSPHNPTGAVIPLSELKLIAELAVKHNLWIISDEAYETVVFDGATHHSLATLIPEYNKVISVFSFSKSHAMSGMRLGYLVCKDKLFGERVGKLLRCTINGVNSVAQWAAVGALENTPESWQQEMTVEYQKRRDLFLKALSHQNILIPFKPQGTFFLWCKLNPQFDSNELSAKLTLAGIGNTPGDCFGQSKETMNSMRFAFSCSSKMVEEGVPLLLNHLKV